MRILKSVNLLNFSYKSASPLRGLKLDIADERPNLNRDQLSYSVNRGCMQSGQSTHKTRPRLVRPLWLVTRNSSSCYLCLVVVCRHHQMTVVALIITVPACDVHSCTILFDLWASRYRKVDKSETDYRVIDMNPSLYSLSHCICGLLGVHAVDPIATAINHSPQWTFTVNAECDALLISFGIHVIFT